MLVKLLYASTCINNFLFTGEERLITARAFNFNCLILWVNIFFHLGNLNLGRVAIKPEVGHHT